MSSAQIRPNLPEPAPLSAPASIPEPQKPMRRGWIWLLISIAVVAGIAQWTRRAAQSKAKPTVTVRSTKVRTGPLEQTIRITGMTIAQKAALITAPLMYGSRRDGDYSLTLQELIANGVTVKKGEKLAEFDRLYMQLRLDDYEAVVDQHERYLKILYAQLDVTRTAHNRKIAQAKGAWDKALLNLKTAPVRSAIAIEKYQLAADEAKSRYDEYLVQAKYLDTSEMAAIKRLELDVRECKLEAQRARNNMDKMFIRAPLDGLTVIQSIQRGTDQGRIEAGDRLQPGQLLMQVVDVHSMIVSAAVNQVDADAMRMGAKAHIRVDAFPDLDLPGRVVSIGAFAKMGTYRRSYLSEVPVRIKFEKLDSRLIPNYSVSADVVLSAKDSATIVPRECLFEEAGGEKHFAYVRNGDRWERREVQVGLENNTASEITGGLQSGEEVAAERVPAELLAGMTP
jgi:multidrug efflux pump subunit AcrA (membrane-fusion protein)